ncbi:family 20 glycoside hydrolase, partial [Melampsora larici-populina 98AG31]
NFFPILDLKQTINVMSCAKLKYTFHWHMVDAQSLPLKVPSLPLLNQKGAYSCSKCYSRDDIQEFIAHTNSKGVDVMIEINGPGHTSIVICIYVDCAWKNSKCWWESTAEQPSGQLCIMDERAVQLAKEIYTKIAQEVSGTFFSTGGDEVVSIAKIWLDLPKFAMGMNLTQVWFNFVNQTCNALFAIGKTPVIWEELVLDDNLTLGLDTIVTVWPSSANAQDVGDKGYHIIHAASNFAYLNWYIVLLSLKRSKIYLQFWLTFQIFELLYSYDLYTNITDNQHRQIMGVDQDLLWSEQTDPQNLDTLLW